MKFVLAAVAIFALFCIVVFSCVAQTADAAITISDCTSNAASQTLSGLDIMTTSDRLVAPTRTLPADVNGTVFVDAVSGGCRLTLENLHVDRIIFREDVANSEITISNIVCNFAFPDCVAFEKSAKDSKISITSVEKKKNSNSVKANDVAIFGVLNSLVRFGLPTASDSFESTSSVISGATSIKISKCAFGLNESALTSVTAPDVSTAVAADFRSFFLVFVSSQISSLFSFSVEESVFDISLGDVALRAVLEKVRTLTAAAVQITGGRRAGGIGSIGNSNNQQQNGISFQKITCRIKLSRARLIVVKAVAIEEFPLPLSGASSSVGALTQISQLSSPFVVADLISSLVVDSAVSGAHVAVFTCVPALSRVEGGGASSPLRVENILVENVIVAVDRTPQSTDDRTVRQHGLRANLVEFHSRITSIAASSSSPSSLSFRNIIAPRVALQTGTASTASGGANFYSFSLLHLEGFDVSASFSSSSSSLVIDNVHLQIQQLTATNNLALNVDFCSTVSFLSSDSSSTALVQNFDQVSVGDVSLKVTNAHALFLRAAALSVVGIVFENNKKMKIENINANVTESSAVESGVRAFAVDMNRMTAATASAGVRAVGDSLVVRNVTLFAADVAAPKGSNTDFSLHCVVFHVMLMSKIESGARVMFDNVTLQLGAGAFAGALGYFYSVQVGELEEIEAVAAGSGSVLSFNQINVFAPSGFNVYGGTRTSSLQIGRLGVGSDDWRWRRRKSDDQTKSTQMQNENQHFSLPSFLFLLVSNSTININNCRAYSCNAATLYFGTHTHGESAVLQGSAFISNVVIVDRTVASHVMLATVLFTDRKQSTAVLATSSSSSSSSADEEHSTRLLLLVHNSLILQGGDARATITMAHVSTYETELLLSSGVSPSTSPAVAAASSVALRAHNCSVVCESSMLGNDAAVQATLKLNIFNFPRNVSGISQIVVDSCDIRLVKFGTHRGWAVGFSGRDESFFTVAHIFAEENVDVISSFASLSNSLLRSAIQVSNSNIFIGDEDSRETILKTTIPLLVAFGAVRLLGETTAWPVSSSSSSSFFSSSSQLIVINNFHIVFMLREIQVTQGSLALQVLFSRRQLQVGGVEIKNSTVEAPSTVLALAQAWDGHTNVTVCMMHVAYGALLISSSSVKLSNLKILVRSVFVSSQLTRAWRSALSVDVAVFEKGVNHLLPSSSSSSSPSSKQEKLFSFQNISSKVLSVVKQNREEHQYCLGINVRTIRVEGGSVSNFDSVIVDQITQLVGDNNMCFYTLRSGVFQSSNTAVSFEDISTKISFSNIYHRVASASGRGEFPDGSAHLGWAAVNMIDVRSVRNVPSVAVVDVACEVRNLTANRFVAIVGSAPGLLFENTQQIHIARNAMLVEDVAVVKIEDAATDALKTFTRMAISLISLPAGGGAAGITSLRQLVATDLDLVVRRVVALTTRKPGPLSGDASAALTHSYLAIRVFEMKNSIFFSDLASSSSSSSSQLPVQFVFQNFNLLLEDVHLRHEASDAYTSAMVHVLSLNSVTNVPVLWIRHMSLKIATSSASSTFASRSRCSVTIRGVDLAPIEVSAPNAIDGVGLLIIDNVSVAQDVFTTRFWRLAPRLLSRIKNLLPASLFQGPFVSTSPVDLDDGQIDELVVVAASFGGAVKACRRILVSNLFVGEANTYVNLNKYSYRTAWSGKRTTLSSLAALVQFSTQLVGVEQGLRVRRSGYRGVNCTIAPPALLPMKSWVSFDIHRRIELVRFVSLLSDSESGRKVVGDIGGGGILVDEVHLELDQIATPTNVAVRGMLLAFSDDVDGIGGDGIELLNSSIVARNFCFPTERVYPLHPHPHQQEQFISSSFPLSAQCAAMLGAIGGADAVASSSNVRYSSYVFIALYVEGRAVHVAQIALTNVALAVSRIVAPRALVEATGIETLDDRSADLVQVDGAVRLGNSSIAVSTINVWRAVTSQNIQAVLFRVHATGQTMAIGDELAVENSLVSASGIFCNPRSATAACSLAVFFVWLHPRRDFAVPAVRLTASNRVSVTRANSSELILFVVRFSDEIRSGNVSHVLLDDVDCTIVDVWLRSDAVAYLLAFRSTASLLRSVVVRRTRLVVERVIARGSSWGLLVASQRWEQFAAPGIISVVDSTAILHSVLSRSGWVDLRVVFLNGVNFSASASSSSSSVVNVSNNYATVRCSQPLRGGHATYLRLLWLDDALIFSPARNTNQQQKQQQQHNQGRLLLQNNIACSDAYAYDTVTLDSIIVSEENIENLFSASSSSSSHKNRIALASTMTTRLVMMESVQDFNVEIISNRLTTPWEEMLRAATLSSSSSSTSERKKIVTWMNPSTCLDPKLFASSKEFVVCALGVRQLFLTSGKEANFFGVNNITLSANSLPARMSATASLVEFRPSVPFSASTASSSSSASSSNGNEKAATAATVQISNNRIYYDRASPVRQTIFFINWWSAQRTMPGAMATLPQELRHLKIIVNCQEISHSFSTASSSSSSSSSSSPVLHHPEAEATRFFSSAIVDNDCTTHSISVSKSLNQTASVGEDAASATRTDPSETLHIPPRVTHPEIYSPAQRAVVVAASVVAKAPGVFQFSFKIQSARRMAACASAQIGFEMDEVSVEANPFGVTIGDDEYADRRGAVGGNVGFVVTFLVAHFFVAVLRVLFFAEEDATERRKQKREKRQQRQQEDVDWSSSSSSESSVVSSSSSSSASDSDGAAGQEEHHHPSPRQRRERRIAAHLRRQDRERRRLEKQSEFTLRKLRRALDSVAFPSVSLVLVLGVLGPETLTVLGALYGARGGIFSGSKAVLLALVGFSTFAVLPVVAMVWCAVHLWRSAKEKLIKKSEDENENQNEDHRDDDHFALCKCCCCASRGDEEDDDAVLRLYDYSHFAHFAEDHGGRRNNNNHNNNNTNKKKKKQKKKSKSKKSKESEDETEGAWSHFTTCCFSYWLEWKETKFVSRWGEFFISYRFPLLSAFDYAVCGIIALASGYAESCPTSVCCQGWASVAVAFSAIHLAMLIFFRPFLRLFDVVFFNSASILTLLETSFALVQLTEKNDASGGGGGAGLEPVAEVVSDVSLYLCFVVLAVSVLEVVGAAWQWCAARCCAQKQDDNDDGKKNRSSKKKKTKRRRAENENRNTDSPRESGGSRRRPSPRRTRLEDVLVANNENNENNENDSDVELNEILPCQLMPSAEAASQ